jgi:cell division protein DivIC
MSNSPSSSNKQGQKRRIRLVMFFMLCFSVWTGYTVYLQSGILSEKERELENLRQEAAVVQQTQAELSYKANRLNDKEYIAELARKQLFLSKPGEKIFVLPE